MFLNLLERDEARAYHFVDNLDSQLKLALRNYWKENGYDKYFQMFFNK